MKKKCFYLFAMMMMAISANAQNEVGQVTLKPMVGINLATVTDLHNSDMRVGLAAGVEAEFGVAENFSISAGALYSMQGCKFSESGTDLTIKADYINVPILANYYVIPGLAIKAGIQPAFNVSDKAEAEAGGTSAEVDLNDLGVDVNGFYLSIPVGASYEYKNFVLDARYNIGVTKAAKDLDSKHNVFQFTLGYKFSL